MCPNTGDTLVCDSVCVCVRDVLYLRGCGIISAIENHSRFHSLIMTVFAHDRAREGGSELVLLPQTWRDGWSHAQIHTKNLNYNERKTCPGHRLAAGMTVTDSGQ